MTPKNVLIVGDSYTAAPRIALRDDAGRWPDFSPAILAMPGYSLGALLLEGDCLVPRDDSARHSMNYYNGVTAMPLAGYDAFVVIGGLNFYPLANAQNACRSLDFPSVMRGEACRLVSAGFMDAVIRHHVQCSPGFYIARLLAGLGQGPVLFMDAILPSADCWQDAERFDPYIAMADRGDALAFHARYQRILRQALGHEVRHLPQPAETVVEEVFTAPEWVRGSLRMQTRRDVPHEETDFGHPNPAYGAVQVDLIASALARL